jgi:hypothetical protein
MGQFVRHRADQVHRVVQAGAIDTDDELLPTLAVGAGRLGEVLPGVIDQPDFAGVGDKFQMHEVGRDVHVAADALEQPAGGAFGAVVGVGEALRRRQHERTTVEGVVVELVAEPAGLLDPRLGRRVARTRWRNNHSNMSPPRLPGSESAEARRSKRLADDLLAMRAGLGILCDGGAQNGQGRVSAFFLGLRLPPLRFRLARSVPRRISSADSGASSSFLNRTRYSSGPKNLSPFF